MSFLNNCSPGACLKALRTSAVVMAGALTMVLAAPAVQAAHSDGPLVPAEIKSGNPTCTNFYGSSINGEELIEFKYEPVVSAIGVGDGTLSVDIVVDGKMFSWAATGGNIIGIFAKGGPGGHLYDYADLSDPSVHAPVQTDHDNGLTALEGRGLSHISFCYTPGAPAVSITKACDGPGVTQPGGTTVLYTYESTITNDSSGDFDLTGFRLKDSPPAGIASCTVTDVGGVAVGIGLNDATFTAIGGGSLASGESLDLEIQCLTSDGVGAISEANELFVEADVVDSADVVENSVESDICEFNATPQIAVRKMCADTPVRLMADPETDELMVEACVEIEVENTGLEALENVTLLDDTVGGIYAAPSGFDIGGLAPGAIHMTGKVCYLPKASDSNLTQDGEELGKYLVWTSDTGEAGNFLAALFDNTAVAIGDGVLSGQTAGPVQATAKCSICWDDDGEGDMACPDPDDVPDPLFQ
ncbi:hypothetical protein [Marinobacterium rhizophilum]|uniref:DUF11 domain-containing protein n=1 Tax=Marinobacterium rhizophilum TaxID=420402 RepID=A0ABY5HJA3_9GAMM|nr:hypothetical protein [Marinobacterium rhizophilum]UTW12189.1 hypothetical protein KDW95_00400 [Marinobacterium rhizophilum]